MLGPPAPPPPAPLLPRHRQDRRCPLHRHRCHPHRHHHQIHRYPRKPHFPPLRRSRRLLRRRCSWYQRTPWSSRDRSRRTRRRTNRRRSVHRLRHPHHLRPHHRTCSRGSPGQGIPRGTRFRHRTRLLRRQNPRRQRYRLPRWPRSTSRRQLTRIGPARAGDSRRSGQTCTPRSHRALRRCRWSCCSFRRTRRSLRLPSHCPPRRLRCFRHRPRSPRCHPHRLWHRRCSYHRHPRRYRYRPDRWSRQPRWLQRIRSTWTAICRFDGDRLERDMRTHRSKSVDARVDRLFSSTDSVSSCRVTPDTRPPALPAVHLQSWWWHCASVTRCRRVTAVDVHSGRQCQARRLRIGAGRHIHVRLG